MCVIIALLAVRCNGLPDPEHGHYFPHTCKAGAYANNDTCELKCDPGYQVVGKKYKYCLSDQTWSGPGDLHMCKGNFYIIPLQY